MHFSLLPGIDFKQLCSSAMHQMPDVQAQPNFFQLIWPSRPTGGSLFDVVGLRSQKHIHGDITKIPFRILNPGVHSIAVCTSVFSTRLRPGADRDVLKGIAPIGLTGLETTGNRPRTLLDLFFAWPTELNCSKRWTNFV